MLAEVPILDGGDRLGKDRQLSYPDKFRSYYRVSLQALRSSPPDSVICGPVYIAETSSGLPIRFDTYVYSQPESKKAVILGYNADDIPIAYRHSVYCSRGPSVIAQGYVGTALRGSGVGSVTELVHQDMLSRIAQRTGVLVVYEALDNNSNVLRRAISRYKDFIPKGGDPFCDAALNLRERVRVQEQEQARWYAIFGAYGKFGYGVSLSYDADTFKAFPPRNSSDGFDLEQIDRICLERDVTTDEYGRVSYSPRVTTIETGPLHEVRERKLSRLSALPSLPEAIRFSHVSPTY
ncbi:hypothetical protein COT62_02435 [Candidatus Roizmanbacteria bacterium CG09_land_8_20_14_0_10_41_9]|uniref:Uncharacterized protein n=1 Tax=Candidatus Roizmanbacteria bacterium CG09_land_8_20_14_0_10_41_9 TaxID=1974850 RepID=A0A2H0WSM9_9BACT|nr:MAG: hypothetical protein COT62_02435 [Candidatus Roizmanbacteria bacterium CG09_land_8_20_14_0_10_41_9]